MIDLDRLREARGAVSVDKATYTGNEIDLLGAAGVVLAAPVVWWCSEFGWAHESSVCGEWGHRGCGLVVLVPVKGGQE